MPPPLPYMHPKTTHKRPAIAYPTTIATCCYCGTRAVLVLSDNGRHELACSTCGASLHDLKMLPRRTSDERKLVRPWAIRGRSAKVPRPVNKKSRCRKSQWSDLFDDAFDIIEDISDGSASTGGKWPIRLKDSFTDLREALSYSRERLISIGEPQAWNSCWLNHCPSFRTCTPLSLCDRGVFLSACGRAGDRHGRTLYR